ncbi:nicotinate-nucleotide--dimethylbenzimidazole phosphoribosyltransferase [Phytoactinopolyspora limicola]|uniref:nicotinate-nucleotide--dimethylbenzimidazole phosphoribosyltransferase n=1 Tax=Phytoactinopolyspora limicola TaxID=2715536 RepID=UPI00140B4F20|nr:nicotinate-nucleotide--dimethylbenzimidazole phosphoribosyltransferase [Phytoactinopolyspora limicola]
MDKLLVLGGARSGKSALAEEWARERAGAASVTYVATAGHRPGDAEWADRVARHQQRRPAGWTTVETTDVASVLRAATGTVVVDCLALWLSVVLDEAGAWDDDGQPPFLAVEAAVDELEHAWRTTTANVVAVSNEIGSGVVPATRSGRLFRDQLGLLNQRLAAVTDRVVLCVAGRVLELPPPSVPRWPGAGAAYPAPVGGVATVRSGVPAPIDHDAETRARSLIDGLAKPVGSLGRLEEIAVWLAGRQGRVPPAGPSRVAVTVFAGDHGVAADVSAYPPAVTGAMVRTVAAGQAGINALAAEHGAAVRVRDLGVDAELADLPAEIVEHKVRRGTGRIDSEDALSSDHVRQAIAAGRALAADQQADLLIAGDLGIGNTTVAAALTGAVLGQDAQKVTGRGTGIDDTTLRRKTEIVAAAIERARTVRDDPGALLARIGGADLAAMAGFLAGAAEQGTPVLLDGAVVTSAALVAELLTPGAAAWWLAGHRSVEPAHSLALDHLGLEPIVDLRMRLGEGTGALAALPTIRSAVAVSTRMAALADLEL